MPVAIPRKVDMTEQARLDGVAAAYDQDGFEGLMAHVSAERVASLARGRSCLEVGAAVGITTGYLARAFDSVVVVEPAARYAALLRQRGFPNVTVLEVLVEDLDVTQTFDTIVMSHVLEHVLEPRRVIQAVTEFLADDGVVIAVVPNARSIHRQIGVAVGMIPELTSFTDLDVALGHRRVYDQGTLRADIESAGLRVESLKGHFCKPLSNAQMQQLPIEVQRAFLDLGDQLPVEFASELLVVCRR